MPSPLSTQPPGFIMATTETLPLGFDTTKLLGVGQAPSSPVTVLTNVTTGKVIPLVDGPTVVGNIITQVVRGSALTTGHKFVLSVTFTVVAVATTWTMVLVITAPAVV